MSDTSARRLPLLLAAVVIVSTAALTSAPIAVGAPVGSVFSSAPAPTITGTATVGSTLTVAYSSNPRADAYTIQWSASGSGPIAGATGTTFVPTAAQVGRTISVQVVAVKAGYVSASGVSPDTAPVSRADFSTGPSPTISGTAQVGSTLTAIPGATVPAATSLAYQWQAGGVSVSGATSTTFTPTAAQLAQTVTVTVTASKAGYRDASATSSPTNAVAKADFVVGPAPQVTGTPRVGQTLTAEPGTTSPPATAFGYQWNADGTPIAGATDAGYDLTPAEAGSVITVTVTATRAGFNPATATSAATGPVDLADFGTAWTPSISGTARLGQTLTAETGTVPGVFRYQWNADGNPIAGATDSAYDPTVADVGSIITVTVTASRAGYRDGVATSVGTDPVAAADFGSAPTPVIDGIPRVGHVLVADPGTTSPAADSWTYQWNADDTPIDGATADSYDLGAADVDAIITVTVTAHRTGYADSAATSDPVGPVALAEFDSGPTPAISGTARVGHVLVADPGTTTPAADSWTYQWNADDTPIDGATSRSYELRAGDAGAAVTVTVTAHRSGYADAADVSDATDPVELAEFTSIPTPTITGPARVGETLSADPWQSTPSADSVDYQWSADGSPIKGATAATYRLTPAEAGARVSVTITAGRPGYADAVVTSEPAGPVDLGRFSVGPDPTLTGSAQVGQTVTVDPGTVAPTPDRLTYTWYVRGGVVRGVTGPAYTLQSADRGAPVKVVVNATRAGYVSSTATARLGVVTLGKFTAAPALTVTGVAQVGQSVTADPGLVVPVPDTLVYTWYLRGAAVPGVTGTTYTFQPGDEGATVKVVVTATKLGYQNAISTTRVGPVAALRFTVGPTATIAGTAQVGQTLSADPGLILPAADRLTYSWYARGLVISGATGSTYTLRPEDAGAVVRVVVTASRPGYLPVKSASAPIRVAATP